MFRNISVLHVVVFSTLLYTSIIKYFLYIFHILPMISVSRHTYNAALECKTKGDLSTWGEMKDTDAL